jgi:hypothetical protein
MDFWMQIVLEIWIVEYLQEGVCLTYLKEQKKFCSGTLNYRR